MPKDTFQTQILILGLIDYFGDILKSDAQKEVRNNLLAAIQATFTNKLLEDPETSIVFKEALIGIPSDSSLEAILDSLQKSLGGKQVNVDLLPILKESAREVLNDFVTKAQRPELAEQINGLLQ